MFSYKVFQLCPQQYPRNPGSIVEICLIFHPLRAHCTALADFIKNRRICMKQIFVSALSTGCK